MPPGKGRRNWLRQEVPGRGGCKCAMESELACDGRGLVGNGTSTGHGGSVPASGRFKDRLPLAFPGSLEAPHRFKDTALCVLSQKVFASERDFTGFL